MREFLDDNPVYFICLALGVYIPTALIFISVVNLFEEAEENPQPIVESLYVSDVCEQEIK